MSKDLVAKVESYEQDGKTKYRYVKVGVILTSEHGEYALLDPTVNLAGVMIKQRLMNPQKASSSIMCGIFDRDEQKQAKPAASPAPAGGDDFSDDIPF